MNDEPAAIATLEGASYGLQRDGTNAGRLRTADEQCCVEDMCWPLKIDA